MQTSSILCVVFIAGYLLLVNAGVSSVDGHGKDDSENRLQRLEKYLVDHEERLKDCELGQFQDNIKREKRANGFVGFTAYLDHPIDHLGIDQPIVYDRILLNAGNAYNPNTGHFTVPIEGYYVFSYYVYINNLQATGDRQIVAKLSVDGINEVDGIADTYHTHHEAQGGNFVVLYLRVGQVVYIQNYRWSDKDIDGSANSRMSTFSGYLVN